MLKSLMALGGTLALLLVAAAPAVAQADDYRHTGTGVLGEPYTVEQDPTLNYPLTDEASGTVYELSSGFVYLEPYVGEWVTFEGQKVPGLPPGPDDPIPVNVTSLEPVDGGAPAPEIVVVTGALEAVAEPSAEGPTHLITEHSTGDVYGLFSDAQGVDLSQYEGQSVAVYGVFQTQGAPISDFADPADVLIYVTSAESLEPAPVAPPPEVQADEDLNVEITGVLREKDLRPPHPTWSITEGLAGVEWTLVGGDVDLSQYVGQRVKVQGIFQTMGNPLPADPTVVPVYVTSLEVLDPAPATDDQYTDSTDTTAVLPDTGGFSPAVLGLVALLLLGGGGLLAYSFIRR